MEAAKLGTLTHKIVELYWKSFNEHQEAIFNKMAVFEDGTKRSHCEEHASVLQE